MFLWSSGQGLEYANLENNGTGLQSENQVDIWWDPLMSQICVFSLPLLCHLGMDVVVRLFSWASRCSGKRSLICGKHKLSLAVWLPVAAWLLPLFKPELVYMCVLYFDSYTKWIVPNFWAIKNPYTLIFVGLWWSSTYNMHYQRKPAPHVKK